jgi:hypothetical protein
MKIKLRDLQRPFSFLKVIIMLFVAKNMDNTLWCGCGSDAECRFLDTGYMKVIIFFYPASSIQYPVSETLWNKRSLSKFCLF